MMKLVPVKAVLEVLACRYVRPVGKDVCVLGETNEDVLEKTRSRTNAYLQKAGARREEQCLGGLLAAEALSQEKKGRIGKEE